MTPNHRRKPRIAIRQYKRCAYSLDNEDLLLSRGDRVDARYHIGTAMTTRVLVTRFANRIADMPVSTIATTVHNANIRRIKRTRREIAMHTSRDNSRAVNNAVAISNLKEFGKRGETISYPTQYPLISIENSINNHMISP